MHLSQALLGLGLYAGSALSAALTVTNQCSGPVHIVYDNDQYRAGTLNLATGKKFDVQLSGQGNSVGFSIDPNFYAGTTPKLIFGFSDNTADKLLYYSITAQNGSPLASFSLTSGNSQCTSVNSPNGVTYACADSSTLTFVACG